MVSSAIARAKLPKSARTTVAFQDETFAQIKGLVFDLDGTLYRQEPVRRVMAWRILRAHLFHPLRGIRTLQMLRAYRHALETLRVTHVSGNPSTQQIRMAARECNMLEFEMEICVRHWNNQALDLLSPALRPGVVEVLQLARKKGMLLGVLSDYPAEDKLSAMALRDYFDIVVSAVDPEVQRLKPDSRGLEVVVERLGLEKHEVMYIGDRPLVDGRAAVSAGMPCAILASGCFRPGPWWKIENFDDIRHALFAR